MVDVADTVQDQKGRERDGRILLTGREPPSSGRDQDLALNRLELIGHLLVRDVEPSQRGSVGRPERRAARPRLRDARIVVVLAAEVFHDEVPHDPLPA